jgi:hypothetical protein
MDIYTGRERLKASDFGLKEGQFTVQHKVADITPADPCGLQVGARYWGNWCGNQRFFVIEHISNGEVLGRHVAITH